MRIPIPEKMRNAAQLLREMAGRMDKRFDTVRYAHHLREAADLLETSGPDAAKERIFQKDKHNTHYYDYRSSAHNILKQHFEEVLGKGKDGFKLDELVAMVVQHRYFNCVVICQNEAVRESLLKALAPQRNIAPKIRVICENEKIRGAHDYLIIFNPSKRANRLADGALAKHNLALVASGTVEERWAQNYRFEKREVKNEFGSLDLFHQEP